MDRIWNKKGMVGKGKNIVIAKVMESKRSERNGMNMEGKGWEGEEREGEIQNNMERVRRGKEGRKEG